MGCENAMRLSARRAAASSAVWQAREAGRCNHACSPPTHCTELYGRVLRVNYAQPNKIKGGDKGFATQAVWADADDW